MAVDLAVLRSVNALAGLTEEDLAKVAALGTLEERAGGVTIFREEDPANDVYFVVRGRVALSVGAGSGRETMVLTVGPGELLGFSGLLPQNRVASARTQTATTLVRFDGEQLLALCAADHDVGYAVMKHLFAITVQRLQETRMQLLDMYGERGSLP